MNKKLIAAAISGLVAIPALAEVTVYGVLDIGVESVGAEVNGVSSRLVRVTSGFNSGNRIGFKGSESLGDGLTAGFVLENGFRLDTAALKNAGTLTSTTTTTGGVTTTTTTYASESDKPKFFDRQAYLYLDSASYGRVGLGRQYSPIHSELNVYLDPTAVGFGGWTVPNYIGRVDNSISYAVSPTAGFKLSGLYGVGNETFSTTDSAVKKSGQTWSGTATYNAGPVFAGIGVGSVKGTDGMSKNDVTLFGGVYDFGPAKLHIGLAQGKSTDMTGATVFKQNMGAIGTTIPLSEKNSVIALYSQNKNKLATSQKFSQFTVMFNQQLTKRTSWFAGYAYVKGDNAMPVAINYADATALTSTNNFVGGGTKSDSVAVGVRHVF